DGKDTKSCSISSKFPTCTSTFKVTTSTWPEQSSTKVTTATTTSCYTVTACTGSASTTSTTTSTTTTIEEGCGRDSCGSSCNTLAAAEKRRRAVPTSVPTLGELMEDQLETSNVTVLKREVPGSGTGDWTDFYKALREDPNTFKVNIQEGVLGTPTFAQKVTFTGKDQRILIEQFWGCLSVIVISHRGVFVSHFYENESIKNQPVQFQSDVIEILRAYLGFSGDRVRADNDAIFTGPVQIFIFAGTRRSAVLSDTNSLFESDSVGVNYQKEVDNIKSVLAEDKMFPGITPTVFAYLKMVNDDNRAKGAWGKIAVAYTPNQKNHPDTGAALPPNTAVWQVYLQAKKYQEVYANSELQIWRSNDKGSALGAANVLQPVTPGTVIDPCGGDLSHGVSDSEVVPDGSEVIDVGPEAVLGFGSPQLFTIRDGNDDNIHTKCVFKGNGKYEPFAEEGKQNLIAGAVTCEDGFKVNCLRPFDNRATTCGGQPLNKCGIVGKGCFPYWQLLATCRI
ncbi:hypothetical protein K458DRAFT_298053, partial [Lentithecium fluviatile CBS 122367]